jgi:protein ImuB
VDRWACVSLTALPLQLALRHKPEWRALPVVVVTEDKPQGKVLWANTSALAAAVLPGQTYALALSLCAGLHACVVSELEVAAMTQEIKTLLWHFSPSIEAGDEAGVFWLDASGLSRMYVSLELWAKSVRQHLLTAGLQASVVVGFSRFGTYALARAAREQRVFVDEAEERHCVEQVPLACLDIEPAFRDLLSKLGVHTIAALLCLPAAGLLTRFGPNAARLYALAGGEFAPLQAEVWRAPLSERALLDSAETDTTRLLFVIKRLLDAVLGKLVLRAQALSSLTLSFKLDRKRGSFEPAALRPAVPTLDVLQLMDLVRLWLESQRFELGVVEVELVATGVPTTSEQLQVFAEQPRRDLAAANRAVARLRAEFGETVVVRAVLRDGHLPEACFGWEPVEAVQLPAAKMVRPPDALVIESAEASLARRPMIRRIFRRPEVLSAPARQLRNDGWLIRGAQHGPVTHTAGPYLVNGGWWLREIQREYQFVMTRRGELLWVYHDKRRRRWFLHGEVQ